MPERQTEKAASDKQFQVVGWLVALFCALVLPTGAAKLLPGLVAHPGKRNEDAAKAMIQVFSLTGPLVLAAAFTTLCMIREWFEKQAIWVLPLVFFAAWIVGRLGLGTSPAVPDHVPNTGHPAAMVVAFVLKGYADVTGWPLTLVSLVLGSFFGWVANNEMPDEWRQLLDEKFQDQPK